MHLTGRRILLIISGGIAAYKALDLIRLIKKSGATVRPILTKGGAQFVTPLSVSALAGERVFDDLWSLNDEAEMGHIRLSRESDLVIVAPASADLMTKMAGGHADDLASTVLLASDKPILVAPAMNPLMWDNAATQDNIQTLKDRGIMIVGPCEGDMACGETGMGRMAEPDAIMQSITDFFAANKPLAGKHAIVTSGPTYEPIDPVRFLGNRSSGKQGHAIAQALRDAGAGVTLVTGPVALPDPDGVKVVHIETAQEMLDATLAALPADIAVCAAAVADWRAEEHSEKIKKRGDGTPPSLHLSENQDILKTLGQMGHNQRPTIVAGFAAETHDLINAARDKQKRKAVDFILANDVSGGQVFGADTTHLHLIGANDHHDDWGIMDKMATARKLTEIIVKELKK